ncbi:MAG: porin [Albidovulum sp.]|nr:porin [Albidovulum sp.]
MKKLLYSSAVLIASCGMAAAQVSVGGAAKVGIKYTEGAGMGMSIFHDVDLTLALSGQTDGGLSFGAEMTIDNNQGVDSKLTMSSDEMSDTQTAPDSDTNTHPGMYYDAMGKAVFLGADGMPVYSVMDEAGSATMTTYISNVRGSTFTLAEPTTPQTTNTAYSVMMIEIPADGDDPGSLIAAAVDDDGKADNVPWAEAFAGNADTPTGGAIYVVGMGEYAVETGTAANFNIVKKVGTSWVVTNSTPIEYTAASDEAGLLVNKAGTDDGKVSANLAAVLTAIDRALSAMNDGSAVDQMPDQNEISFTDTKSVESAELSNNNLSDDSSVYISGGFGKISVGAVDAGDNFASGIADVGFDGIGVDDVAEGLRGKSAKDFLYEFTAGGVSFGLSADAKGDNSALGIKYSLDPISVGIGYANLGEGDNVLSIGIGASLGGVSTNLMYSTQKSGGTATGMDASFAAADNMTVTIAAASEKDAMGMSESAYGLGLSFDLGGGATLGTGVGSVRGVTKAELGLGLTF